MSAERFKQILNNILCTMSETSVTDEEFEECEKLKKISKAFNKTKCKEKITEVLLKIVAETNMSKKTFYDWLMLEVGLNQEEIEFMISKNMIPVFTKA